MPTAREPQAPALPVIERGVRLALKRDDYLYGPSYKHVLNVEVFTVGADLAQYPVMEWLWLTVTVNGSAPDADPIPLCVRVAALPDAVRNGKQQQ